MATTPPSIRLTLILGALTAFPPLSIDIYLPSLPTLVRTFGTTDGAVQLTLPAFFLGLALGQLFYGPLSDRYGRRPALLIGIALYTLASAACALAPSIEALLAGRFVQALGGSAGMTIAMAVVRDRFDPREGARTLSLLMLAPGSESNILWVLGFRATSAKAGVSSRHSLIPGGEP